MIGRYFASPLLYDERAAAPGRGTVKIKPALLARSGRSTDGLIWTFALGGRRLLTPPTEGREDRTWNHLARRGGRFAG